MVEDEEGVIIKGVFSLCSFSDTLNDLISCTPGLCPEQTTSSCKAKWVCYDVKAEYCLVVSENKVSWKVPLILWWSQQEGKRMEGNCDQGLKA